MAGRGLLVLVAPTRTGSGRRPSPRAPSLFGRRSRSRPLLADELHPGGATRLNVVASNRPLYAVGSK
jgi:hypothetical protein